MAEGASAAAAAAPSGGPAAKGGSSSSSGAWWKSLTAKKKPKEDSGPAWLPAEAPEMLSAPPRPSDSQDSQPLASGGGGGSSRRNLKISRSGRFKEKRKVRATLLAESPQKLFEGGAGGAAGSTSPAPAHPSPETTPGP